MVAVEWGVELAQYGQGLLASGVRGHAQDDTVRAGEVFYRCAFFQEFGVGYDAEGGACTGKTCVEFGLYGGRYFVGSANGDSGLVYHHLVIRHVAANVAGGGQHVLQVGAAVFVWRGANGDELHAGMRHTGGHVGRKSQPTGFHIALAHLF